MIINQLQLNTSILRNPQKIIDFIINNDINIACLQEICYPTNDINPIQELAKQNQLNYIEGVHYHYLPTNQSLAVAIITNLPIIDHFSTYFNSDDYQPKKIDHQTFSGLLLNDEGQDNLPGSRGLKHSIKSRSILTSLLQTPQGPLRAITTHFSVSDLCTELQTMYDMALVIKSLVQYAKPYPTIFSGDLNIRAQSYSVAKLSEVLTCHTTELKDTLSNTHVSKQRDFPEGLAIDHTFSKNIKHLDTHTIEVDFSEHKAVVSSFELM